MSNNFTPTRKVSVVVQIGGVQVPVTSVVMTHQINNIPYVEIMLQLDNQDAISTQTGKIGAVNIDLSLFGKFNAAMQSHILNDFSLETDLQVYVVDGDGNNILFKGYLGKPQFRLSNGQVILSVAGAHAMAIMMAYTGQIYQSQEFYASPYFQNFFTSPTAPSVPNISTAKLTQIAAVDLSQVQIANSIINSLEKNVAQKNKTNSIAYRTNVILTGLFNSYPDQIALTNINQEPLNQVVHNLNKLVLPYVQAFLNNSFASTLIDGLIDPDFTLGEETLHKEIFDGIVSQPNFLSTIGYLLSQFLFQLNAGWGGDDAKNSFWMEHLFTHDDPGDRLIQVPIQNVSFSMASIFEIPIIQVIVQGGGSEYFGLSGNLSTYIRNQPLPSTPLPAGETPTDVEGNATLLSIARYPPLVSKQAQGTYFTAQAPRWISKDNFTLATTSWLQQPFKDGDKFAAAPSNQTALQNILSGQESARIKVLKYFAEFVYKDIYLQKAQATVSIPLNVKIQVGRTYTVKSIEGDELFVGYLAGISHNIVVAAEGAAAMTHLDFTHVKAAGVVIKALQNDPTDTNLDLDSSLRNLNSTNQYTNDSVIA